MIRSRIPLTDDRKIVQMVNSELIPYSYSYKNNHRVTLKEIRNRLKEGSTYVVTEKGTAIGFIHWLVSGGEIMIDMLAVDGRTQGRGLGSKLLQAAEYEGLRQHCYGAYLFVDASNHRGARFYERQGYSTVEYLTHIDCYRLYKKLISN